MYLALSSSVRRSAYERFYYAHHVRDRCRLSTVSAAWVHLGSGLGACRQVFLLLVPLAFYPSLRHLAEFVDLGVVQQALDDGVAVLGQGLYRMFDLGFDSLGPLSSVLWSFNAPEIFFT